MIYSETLDHKLACRFIKLFPGINELLVRPSKNCLTTTEIRKIITLLQEKIRRVKLIGQSQIDIGKLVYVGVGLKDLDIDFCDLEAFEIIGFNSNLINERSLLEIAEEANNLHTLNLTNLDVF